jgi:hypothetical protein
MWVRMSFNYWIVSSSATNTSLMNPLIKYFWQYARITWTSIYMRHILSVHYHCQWGWHVYSGSTKEGGFLTIPCMKAFPAQPRQHHWCIFYQELSTIFGHLEQYGNNWQTSCVLYSFYKNGILCSGNLNFGTGCESTLCVLLANTGLTRWYRMFFKQFIVTKLAKWSHEPDESSPHPHALFP